MNEFVEMLLIGVLASNIVSGVGFGAITLQSEKRNFKFVLTTLLTTIITTVIVGLIYAVLNMYVFVPYNVEFIGVMTIAVLAVCFTYLSRYIVKVISVEQYYLYEKSYQFAIQTILTIGVLLLVNYDQSLVNVVYQLAMYCLGFLGVQLIFYPLYERLDNRKVLKPARNVPLMIYVLAVLAMIFSAIQMMI